MTTLLAILGAALVAIVIIGYLLTVINFVERVAGLWRRYILGQPKAEPATKEDVADIKRAVDELRGQVSTYLDGLPQAKAEVRDPFEEGERLQDADQHEAAIAEFEKAFAAAEDDSQRCALHILIGNSFFSLGQLSEAEDHYQQALEAGQTAADRLGQANALGNLGAVHFERGDLDNAEEHHKRSLAIHEEIGNHLGQANQLGSLGNVYIQGGSLDEAEEHYSKALAIHGEIGNRLGQAQDLGNLGNVYLWRGDLKKAQQYHLSALELYEKVNNRVGQAVVIANLGLLAERRGKLNEALELLERARALYEQVHAGGQGPEIVRRALERLGAP